MVYGGIPGRRLKQCQDRMVVGMQVSLFYSQGLACFQNLCGFEVIQAIKMHEGAFALEAGAAFKA